MVEDTRHLLWECRESRNIWNLFNAILMQSNNNNYTINSYEDLYNMKASATVNTIQELIQIERPVKWSLKEVINKLNEIRVIELYIEIKNNDLYKHKIKWKCFETFLRQND
jgi:hypothetical protein